MPEATQSICNEIIDVLKKHHPDNFTEAFSILATLFATLGVQYFTMDEFQSILDDIKYMCHEIENLEDKEELPES